MSIALDIIVVVILISSTVKSYKNGFLKTLINMVGTIISLIAAYLLATPVGNFINTNIIKPIFSNVFTNMLVKNGIDTANNQTFVETINEAPEFLTNILEKFNVSIEEIINNISLSSQNVVNDFVDKSVESVSQSVSFAIAFLLVFIICLVAVYFLAKAAGLANKIPVLGSVNKILGWVLGVVSGLLTVFILTYILNLIIPYIQNIYEIPIDSNTIENTLVYKYFDWYNPIKWIFK